VTWDLCSLLRISRLYSSHLLLSLHKADSHTAPSLIAVSAGAFVPSALPLEHPQYLRRLPRLPRSPCFQGLLSDLHIFILSLLSLQVSFPNPQLSSRAAPTIPNMLIPQIADLKARINNQSSRAPSYPPLLPKPLPLPTSAAICAKTQRSHQNTPSRNHRCASSPIHRLQYQRSTLSPDTATLSIAQLQQD
jgi:hypothetical protein